MIIEAYGIKLQRLTADYIEMVRQWRNSEHVRNNMEYREYITPEMQQKWFREIDNERNNYFLISVDDKWIGVISGTQIDWTEMVTHNGGIFIADKSYWETTYPAKASVLLTDLGFYLGMKKNYVKILRSNAASIAFNTSLGYALVEGQEDKPNQLYVLERDKYFQNIEKYRKSMGVEGIIQVTVNNANHPSEKNILRVYETLLPEIKSKFRMVNAVGK